MVNEDNWRASEASETLSGLSNRESRYIRECGSTLSVGLARAVPPTNKLPVNFFTNPTSGCSL